MIKAIIFDMDGTIVISEPLHYQAFCELFKNFGFTWDYDEFIKHYAGTGSHNIISTVLKSRGIEYIDVQELVDQKKEMYQRLLSQHKLTIVRGFPEFFEKVKRAGLKWIIASGTNTENVRMALQNIGFAEHFPEIISGEDVKVPKPEPQIFLRAAAKLKVQPEECLVIEDSYAGVKAAKAASMRCISLLTTTDKKLLEEAGADLVVKDFTELRKLKLPSLLRTC